MINKDKFKSGLKRDIWAHMRTANESEGNMKNEYLVQGINGGKVEDCLTAYSLESLKEKSKGGWASWFEELRFFDITNPMSPQPIKI